MKFKALIIFILLIFLIIGCSKNDDKKGLEQETTYRYYEFLKVNNDLTFSGVNELKNNQLTDNEYYQFTYNKGELTRIKSFSSMPKSFHELNKYIFNVNKEWKDININNSTTSKEYTFTNDGDLIKFIISYNDKNLPTSFQVLPFTINYDNFGILGRSVVYSGKIIFDKKKLLDKIIWLDSQAEYRYQYDKNNDVSVKNIFNNGSVLYEYRFSNTNKGIAEGIE
jgi:hypothetical protein